MSLRRYVAKRLLVTIPVLLIVTLVTFMMSHLLPGDPVAYMTQFSEIDDETVQQLRAQYNLNEPIWKQYVLWLGDAIQLEFGQSIISERNVTEEILSRLPYTVLLGVMSLGVALIISIPTGIIAAYKKGELADEVSRVFALLGVSLPNFWLGLILILIFSVRLGLFPVLPPTSYPLLSYNMIMFTLLPAVTIGTASSALLMRLMRSSMVEELNKDYVTMARAKGLPERTVVIKHVVRNSMIAVVTVAALQIAFIVNGAVVIEQVFSYPGIGRLLLNAVSQRDFPIIQATVLMIGVTIVFANLVADIAYAWLDPRIRY
ncbi:ABC transporter permease [Natronoarchaeum rubrum]|uniref:ABC transporter permease n=1 Tax=Natronoarchaeum rubrum TaxID=755311 RepID=UPI0021123028|nr:ABC transporter permease [Natronoarchaeum rubrum]HMB51431.1 ABC transporter permease [Natronoarchaeum rubrum]